MQKNTFTMALWGAAMGFLILDSKTAIGGAQEGLELCIRTVIPSLFPFFVLSSLLTSSLTGTSVLRPLGALCRIPDGVESILLIGFLGGYPVGAQCIYDAWQNGSLSRRDAQRMLGFCNNAGPAFIFGMTATLFTTSAAPWLLWGIQIISALITALLIPGTRERGAKIESREALTLPKALERSVRNMASVCGWVILFRVVLAICGKWIFRSFPMGLQVLFAGILELANGCCAMNTLPLEGTRFLLCAVCLSFGGLCVGMQTVSAVRELGTGMHFPGKVMQTMVSFLLAQLCLPFLFPGDDTVISPLVSAFCVGILATMGFFLKFRENNSRNPTLSVV